MKHLDLTPIKNRHVIGCNDAYLYGPWIDFCFFGDKSWFRGNAMREGHREALKGFKGICVHPAKKTVIKDRWVKIIRRQAHRYGIDDKPDVVLWNKNTGLCAIDFAVKLGASLIILLGFDMKLSEEGNSNWHEDNFISPKQADYDRFKGCAPAIAEDARALGVGIINANPESTMDAFDRMTFQESLCLV